jgi:hypothetical protein
MIRVQPVWVGTREDAKVADRPWTYRARSGMASFMPSENYPRFFDCFLTTGRPGFSRFAARSAPPGVL